MTDSETPELCKIYRRSIINKGEIHNVYLSLMEEMESETRSRGAGIPTRFVSIGLQVLGTSSGSRLHGVPRNSVGISQPLRADGQNPQCRTQA